MKECKTQVRVCAGTSCACRGSFEVQQAIEHDLAERGLANEFEIEATECSAHCGQGPVVEIASHGSIHAGVDVSDVSSFVDECVLKEPPAQDLFPQPGNGIDGLPKMADVGFFKHQRLVVLRNRGLIDPDNIDDYIALDGFEGLAKALLSMTQVEIIDEMKKSGIRGRGGAGFPTGVKWEFCQKVQGDTKYVICNADEGDPGAFMDRSVMEGNPHAVLEGMIIGGKAIGATNGVIYLRDEYPLALKRLTNAIGQLEEYGLLGDNILGSGHSFNIRVVRGGGAFVCGEETSLIASLEGKAGRPRPRPPFPANEGFWSKPTTINNVETWANVPVIINRGGDWYSSIGTESSKGTKVFSLVGKVENTGLVEVPMGTTLRRIIFDIGGGIPDGKKFKAVQSGGPSGGCIPESLIDLPVDYEELAKVGAIMGSGGLIVMDESACMVDVAKFFLSFLVEESCGKCTPCREGVLRMHEILTKIAEGKGTAEDIELLEELAMVVKDASLCALGGTAPNPVLSTLRYFREEYEAHLNEGRCPAGVCRSLITYSIDQEICHGCSACQQSCPVDAISGEKKEPHEIDAALCTKCGACQESCRFDAVLVV
ncbi:MAG: NADH-quinone oxidoreductase subunit NuoF [Planctomycetota bacterium]|nr:NADH-quinone oxidoreductase subunit NuoF [Planctomycetota bacterium]